MADLSSPAGETEETGGGQTVEIELEPVPVSGEEQEGDESPPDYTTVLREVAPPPPPPPLGYEAALATDILISHSRNTLTAEAPPSYRQLFGKEEEPSIRSHTPYRQSHAPYRQRIHTIRRQECQRTETGWRKLMDGNPKMIAKTVAISALLTVGVCCPLAMIMVGSIYYKKCAVREIPLYLIVSGCFILLDIAYHIFLTIFQRYSDNDEMVCSLARKCDCCAFFIFVWLIVGSAWVLGTGLRGDSNCDCRDCPSGVYVFAAVVIIAQYVHALLFVIFCCVSVIKSSINY